MKIPIEQLIYSNYIKYENMIRMTNEVFAGSNANTVNIFIDMTSILKSIILRRDQVLIGDYTVITSCIINLCAHIREFFRTRYRVESKIFIMNCTQFPMSATNFCKDYSSSLRLAIQNSPVINDLITANSELLKILCPYLNDIFYIEDFSCEVGVGIYSILHKISANHTIQQYSKEVILYKDSPSIIFTKDTHLYQLPAMIPNVVIYRCSKYNGEDRSWYINKNNVLNKYIENTRSQTDISTLNLERFNPELLSLIMTLTNLPDRSIKSLLNLSTALKYISIAIDNKSILNGYNHSIDVVIASICGGNLFNNRFDIERRFKAIDILYQYNIYVNNPASMVNMDSVKNLYDPETVKLLNNKYFKSIPLDLNRL